MKKSFVLITCFAAISTFALSSPANAQQKTVKACQDEWRANKTANQAAKITEKAYVDKCRANSAKPAAAATAPAKPTVPAAAAPKQEPAPAAAAPAKPAAPAASAPKSAPAATTAPTGANQYTTETQAKARCPSDTVVWVNLSSKIYHFVGHKDYGHTKSGAYMCEKDTAAAGARAAKNEKHP